MWFVFGRKKKIKPLRDGRRERRKCPLCGEDTTFIEVAVEKKYTAYVVVDLFNTESTAFQCKACDEVMDLESTHEPNLSEREKKKLAKAQAKAEAKRARQQAEEEAARKRQIKEAAEQARAEKAAKENQLDDELAAMKARMGLD
jgi:phosphoenolpyruvate synthase/pyruvate phosphate dikinase